MNKRYKVLIAQSAKEDIKEKKQNILRKFKYRDYATNYSNKIKSAAKELDTFPTAYESCGFLYRGYDILFYPRHGHLLFYVGDETLMTVPILRVLQDGMDWQTIIEKWINLNK